MSFRHFMEIIPTRPSPSPSPNYSGRKREIILIKKEIARKEIGIRGRCALRCSFCLRFFPPFFRFSFVSVCRRFDDASLFSISLYTYLLSLLSYIFLPFSSPSATSSFHLFFLHHSFPLFHLPFFPPSALSPPP